MMMEKDEKESNKAVATSLGPYAILSRIGKGGMGEVLLVYDPVCERKIALKKIRDDLKNHQVIKDRLLREAKITAQLTHPGVISIFTIHDQGDELYYTMPYVKGKNLKLILKEAKEKSRKTPPSKEDSIAALLPIFISICQTIAYAHSHGILHRDLKPENILVGEFGEVILLDWGLAQPIQGSDLPSIEIPDFPAEITHPGKIVGTLAYMSPERAKGAAASVQSDIYALGIILYQILTLQLPFERSSLSDFQKYAHLEQLVEPEEIAPYRDVPPLLSSLVKKCLEKEPQRRIGSVEELISQLLSYMEGRAVWFETAKLKLDDKRDWEFQEHVLISKHVALTQTIEAAEWVYMSISNASFGEHLRMETEVYIDEMGTGIGFLLCIPETAEREEPLEGYCLWLGSDESPGAYLFRNTVEVMHVPGVHLKRKQWHKILIEKQGTNIHFTLNGVKQFTYLSYLPLVGTHIGILAKDANFQMGEIILSLGSQNLQVSCLAIPDAFLASKDYVRALAEYRRIGSSFGGHAEGREALFRAGVTLIEQAKAAKEKESSSFYFSLALDEFAKLHHTPGAPLEYLGKALVYEAIHDYNEEINCLELALRRYPHHPLIEPIQEQVIYRMHESSQNNRPLAYRLILIALRHLPEVAQKADTKRLFKHLIAHWESLPFLENPIVAEMIGAYKDKEEEKRVELLFAAPLAFWLGQAWGFVEIFEELNSLKHFDVSLAGNICFSLIELGAFHLAENVMEALAKRNEDKLQETLALLRPLLIAEEDSVKKGIESFISLQLKTIGCREFRTITALLEKAIAEDQEEEVEPLAKKISRYPLSEERRIALDALRIWAFLKQENGQEAEEIFSHYPLELLNQETTILHTLFGCYLYMTEGEEIAMIHFAGVMETPFPRSWTLLSHFLIGKLDNWVQYSFLWERRALYRQLTLFYVCAGDQEKETYYRSLERKEYVAFVE